MGEVFAGRYELISSIADGGMGSVWQVRDHKDGRLKAAKILRQSDAGSLLRFIREQSVRIDHDHVVTPDSWCGVDDRVLFTMPLIRGGSVAGLVGDFGPLPVAWVAEIVDQTLRALEAVHDAGYVHRDVKPANLLLDATGTARPRVWLSDFGIAVPLNEPRLTRASQVVGSPGYTAPEQFQGADPDPRQDLYGVGMVGLELLTALRPPHSLSAARDLDDPLAQVLLEAASRNPEDRPPSAADLRARLRVLQLPPGHWYVDDDGPHVFDQFAEHPAPPDVARPMPAAPPAPPNPPRRVEGSRVAGYLLLALAVLCAVAAVVLLSL